MNQWLDESIIICPVATAPGCDFVVVENLMLHDAEEMRINHGGREVGVRTRGTVGDL